MKLNLNARELLALHNLLRDKVSFGTTSECVQLQHVYNRIQTCIVSALTNKATDPVDEWLVNEQQKIDKLTNESSKTEERDTDPDTLDKVPPPDDGMSLQDDIDFTTISYPRRSHVSRQKHHKNKK